MKLLTCKRTFLQTSGFNKEPHEIMYGEFAHALGDNVSFTFIILAGTGRVLKMWSDSLDYFFTAIE